MPSTKRRICVMDTELYNSIMDEYKHLLESRSLDGNIDGFKINIANIVLDILKIYLEKTSE
jgi:hypothetical protein